MFGTRRTTILLLLAVFLILLYNFTPRQASSGKTQQFKPIVKDPILGNEGVKAATSVAVPVAATTTPADAVPVAPPAVATSDAVAAATDNFRTKKEFYQDDLKDETYPDPKYDISKLGQYKPHNSKLPGNPTYGLYYATRDATLKDPYFMGAQQIIYRLLWDPRSKTKKYPVTVWVAPFISQQHRDVLTAAGARVRELPLIEWSPTAKTEGRWKDLFSKLGLWNETEYSRIMFMDLDAFPVENMDGLFEVAKREDHCDESQLSYENKLVKNDICDYVFVGPHGEWGEINVGVMVLKPSTAMYNHLVREFQDPSKFDNSMAEQAFLNYIFHRKGPFPVRWVDRTWNALWTTAADEGKVKVVHEKLWAMHFKETHFAAHYFYDTWFDMLKLYNSKEFETMRAADGLL